MFVFPGYLAEAGIPPDPRLFERERKERRERRERSSEIIPGLEISSPGSELGTGGPRLRLVWSEAQKKRGLEIVLEMLMVLMIEVTEEVIPCVYVEVEELVVEEELFSSVLESW